VDYIYSESEDVPIVSVSKEAKCSGLFLNFSYGMNGKKWEKRSIVGQILMVLCKYKRFLKVEPLSAFL
jgi:hypothetical protein